MLKKVSHSILIVGGGGRETALVYAYGKSPHVGKIFAVPGNDLMSEVTDKSVIIFPNLKTTDVADIIKLCHHHHIDLVDIAQDNAVAVGLGDALEREHIDFMGPKKAAGQLEWDKSWSRQFMKANGISHPAFAVFDDVSKAVEYLDSLPDKAWVVKASGLAEGKGVIVTSNSNEAKEALAKMKRFGQAGDTFLLEQRLIGEEFSLFAVCDGEHWQVIGSAQDHKRVFDGDEGPNTGGMGCSTPPLLVTPKLQQEIEREIVTKTIDGMKELGRPYTGILYVGGMMVKDKPYVIEFNARWGDPEAEVLIPGLKTDMFEMSMAVINHSIDQLAVQTDGKARVAVAGTSKGYPVDYSTVKGKEIVGLAAARKVTGVMVFGSGVKRVNGKDFAHGGRLFYVIGEGKNVIEARKKAYKAMSAINIEGDNLHYRTDIGWRDVDRVRLANQRNRL